MPQNNTIHRETFTIRANEVDQQGNLTLSSLCNFFQEVAGNNARELKFDITDLQEQNLTWVLHRMDINIKKLPVWRDQITIETWPAAGDRLRAYRNYRILYETGEEFGNCLSYWMMINYETRMPTRLPKEVLEADLPEREHVTEIKSNRMKPRDKYQKSSEFKVRRSDLDMNQHVNNGKYIEWMTELLSIEEILQIRNFDISYLQESTQSDLITASVLKEDKMFSFILRNQQDKIIALAEAKT